MNLFAPVAFKFHELLQIRLSWEKTLLFVTRGTIFLSLLTPLVFTNQSFFPTLPPQTIYFRALVAASLAFYILLILHNRTYLPRFSPILAPVGVFIGALALTSFLGIHPAKSFWSTLNRMEGVIAFLHYGIFFLVLAGVFQKRKDLIQLLRVAIFVSVPVGIIGLSEYFGLTVLLPWGGMQATMGNSTLYGTYLLFMVFLGVFLTFWEQEKRWKVAAWSLVFFNGTLLLMSGTRAAWLGAMVGLLLLFGVWFFLFQKKSQISRQSILIGVMGFLAIFFVFLSLLYVHVLPSNPFWERYKNLWLDVSSFQNQRFDFWPIAFKAWQESPVFGYGLESFPYAYETFFEPTLRQPTPGLEFYDRAHNIFLELLVASGIVGLLAYLVLMGSAFWLLTRIYRMHRSFAPFVLAALLFAYLVHNFFSFDSTISYSLLFLVFAFTHAWYSPKNPQKTIQTKKVLSSPIKVTSICVVLLLVGFTGYAANAGTWQATNALAKGYYLRNSDPKGTTQAFSLACQKGPVSMRLDACVLASRLMLQAPFQFYGEEKQIFLAALEQNLNTIFAYTTEHPNMFQIKHAVLLWHGYETLSGETGNSKYLRQKERVLKEVQKHNPHFLPLFE